PAANSTSRNIAKGTVPGSSTVKTIGSNQSSYTIQTAKTGPKKMTTINNSSNPRKLRNGRSIAQRSPTLVNYRCIDHVRSDRHRFLLPSAPRAARRFAETLADRPLGSFRPNRYPRPGLGQDVVGRRWLAGIFVTRRHLGEFPW